MAGLKRIRESVFLDTSVLIAGIIDFGSSSRAPSEILDAVAAGRVEQPLTAWHCCLEFFSVATRLPEEYRIRPRLALELIETEILDRFELAELPAGRRRRWLRTAVGSGVRGGRIYDAAIAAAAVHKGAEVFVTDNVRHFGPLLPESTALMRSEDCARRFR